MAKKKPGIKFTAKPARTKRKKASKSGGSKRGAWQQYVSDNSPIPW
jgi:hypothetical protein